MDGDDTQTGDDTLTGEDQTEKEPGAGEDPDAGQISGNDLEITEVEGEDAAALYSADYDGSARDYIYQQLMKRVKYIELFGAGYYRLVTNPIYGTSTMRESTWKTPRYGSGQWTIRSSPPARRAGRSCL